MADDASLTRERDHAPHSERRTLVAAAAVLMLGNVISRLLGVARELVIADRFGATASTSSFVAATTVPTMVYDLLIGGAISAALVPVFSEYLAAGKENELRRAVGTVMAMVALLLGVAALALGAVAPALVLVLVPGLAPDLQEQTVLLTRMALPAVVFLGLSGVTTAFLNARQVFTYPAFSVAMYNVGIIVCAWLFAYSAGVSSLVIGVVIGSVLHLGLQLPALRRHWPALTMEIRHPAVTRILRLYAPVALGLVVSQVGVVIDRNLASRTGDDSLAVLRFATTLVQFPVGMIVTATSTAILPTLSRHAAEDAAVESRKETAGAAYTRTLVMGLRMVLLAIIPLTALMIVEREAVVTLLFQRGAFDALATQRTSLAFLCYAPQLPFVAVDLLLIAAFYARQNTGLPTAVGVAAVMVYLVAGLALMNPLGMPGLALANTLQHTFHALVLLAFIWRPLGGLSGYGLGRAVMQAGVASLLAAGLWWLLARPWLQTLETQGGFGLLVFLGLAGLVWAVVYGSALWAWGVPELRAARAALWQRLQGPDLPG